MQSLIARIVPGLMSHVAYAVANKPPEHPQAARYRAFMLGKSWMTTADAQEQARVKTQHTTHQHLLALTEAGLIEKETRIVPGGRRNYWRWK